MIRQFSIILYKYNVIHTIIGRITLHVEVAGWQRDSLWKVNWRKSVSQKCARIWSDRGIGLWRGREDAVSSSRISRILIAKYNCIIGMQLHELSDNYKSRLRLLISRRLDTYVCVCVKKRWARAASVRAYSSSFCPFPEVIFVCESLQSRNIWLFLFTSKIDFYICHFDFKIWFKIDFKLDKSEEN